MKSPSRAPQLFLTGLAAASGLAAGVTGALESAAGAVAAVAAVVGAMGLIVFGADDFVLALGAEALAAGVRVVADFGAAASGPVAFTAAGLRAAAARGLAPVTGLAVGAPAPGAAVETGAAGFAVRLGAAIDFAAAGAFTALDFGAAFGLEAAVDADFDDDGDLAMDSPTPRLNAANACSAQLMSIRDHNGV